MMTKKEAVDILTAKGIEFDPEASVKDLRALASETVETVVDEPVEVEEVVVEPEPEVVTPPVLVKELGKFSLYRTGKTFLIRKTLTEQLVQAEMNEFEANDLLLRLNR